MRVHFKCRACGKIQPMEKQVTDGKNLFCSERCSGGYLPPSLLTSSWKGLRNAKKSV
jgi:hypothetical protein